MTVIAKHLITRDFITNDFYNTGLYNSGHGTPIATAADSTVLTSLSRITVFPV